MDPILLADHRFYITTLSRKNKLITLDYHDAINKDTGVVEHHKTIMENAYDICHTLDLPIFYKSGNSFKLISRYWLLSYILDHDIINFPAIIFEDESLIPSVQNCENYYLTLLNKRSLPIRTPVHPIDQTSDKAEIIPKRSSSSDATNSRHRSKETGRICPRPGCKGTLLKSIGKNKLKDRQDAYQVTCYYKSNRANPCSFHARLTGYEVVKFKKFDLRTLSWITLLPGMKCPKCQGPVYQRTIHHDEKKIEILDRCAQYYFKKDAKCTWQGKRPAVK